MEHDSLLLLCFEEGSRASCLLERKMILALSPFTVSISICKALYAASTTPARSFHACSLWTKQGNQYKKSTFFHKYLQMIFWVCCKKGFWVYELRRFLFISYSVGYIAIVNGEGFLKIVSSSPLLQAGFLFMCCIYIEI